VIPNEQKRGPSPFVCGALARSKARLELKASRCERSNESLRIFETDATQIQKDAKRKAVLEELEKLEHRVIDEISYANWKSLGAVIGSVIDPNDATLKAEAKGEPTVVVTPDGAVRVKLIGLYSPLNWRRLTQDQFLKFIEELKERISAEDIDVKKAPAEIVRAYFSEFHTSR
jgi:phage FluMu protein Com